MNNRILSFVLALVAAASPLRAQTSLIAGLQYESPSLIAPVVVLTRQRAATEWRATVAGWTMGAAWTRNTSTRRAWLAGIDVTPINSHSSNKLYIDGVEQPELAYHNATVQASFGMRMVPSAAWTTELRVLALKEVVSDLPQPVLDAWSSPFAGIDALQKYEHIAEDDVRRTRVHGVRVTARVQEYAGSSSWGKATVSFTSGRRVGRVFLRANGAALSGHNLDNVSAFLSGGSWDIAGPTALYGHRNGELRMDQATSLNGGADLAVHSSVDLTVRGAWLTTHGETRRGFAFGVTALPRGAPVKLLVGLPENDLLKNRWDRAVVTAGVTLGWTR